MHKDPPVKILLRETERERGGEERDNSTRRLHPLEHARASTARARVRKRILSSCCVFVGLCVVAISARRGRLTMQINPDTMWQPIKDRLENRRAFDQPSRMHDCAPAARTRVLPGLSVSNAFASVTLPGFL